MHYRGVIFNHDFLKHLFWGGDDDMEKTYRVTFFNADNGDVLERETFRIDEFGNLDDEIGYYIATNFDEELDVDADYELVDVG